MEIKPYVRGDEAAILPLFQKAFGKALSVDYWNWRFQNNPFLALPQIHLMWDNNKLVGHYAVSPVEMIIHGEKILTALSMTTMTDPEYAGKGIFTLLAESLYKQVSVDHQCAMVWGFPNSNSHYGFIKNLNWQDIATVPMLTVKSNQLKWTAADFRKVDSFTLEMASSLNKSNSGFRINKTIDFLNWRYVANPSFSYVILELQSEPGHLVVFKSFPSYSDSSLYDIDIMELHCGGQAELIQRLFGAVMLFNQQLGRKINQLNVWQSVFSGSHKLMERCGFSIQAPVIFLGGRSLTARLPEINDYRQWEMGMGYSDVF